MLDFIGQSHRNFRFDLRYRAVTGATRTDLKKQIEQGFPFLPAGCSMQLDRVATRIVLDNLRSAIPSRRPAMVRELKALLESDRYRERVPSLREFMEETGLELEDVYRAGCWQSQSTTSQRSPTGQRYIHHRERGVNVLLFVRQRKAQDGRTVPYTFLGPVEYVSHKGDRPISFEWKLLRPMPADFFRLARVAAG